MRRGLALIVLLAMTACSGPAQSGDAGPTGPAEPARPGVPTESITIPPLAVPPKAKGPVLGADVSWPQCPKGTGIPEKQGRDAPMPLRTARFVVLGLTNGPGFTPNPCLADQVAWVKERHLMAAAYAVASFPEQPDYERYKFDGPFDGNTKFGSLSNAGYQQAVFNIATMRAAGLHTPIIWIDVEPVPIFEWSIDLRANAAVLRGVARGYTSSGYQIGAYSTKRLWRSVVGDFTLGIPEWRAAGMTSRAKALRRCGENAAYQGGPPVMSQWVEGDRDLNVTCPGISAELYRWFHQY